MNHFKFYVYVLMNQLEEKLNKNNWRHGKKAKKIFNIDESGNIYDNATGEVFGNMSENINMS